MQISDNEIIFLIIATIVVSVLMIFIIINLLLVSRNKKLQHKNELLFIQTEFEKNIAKTQAEVAEHTLTEIGADLHDDIGQQLVFGIIQLNQIIDKNITKNEDTTMLLQCRDAMQHTLQSVRSISKTLSSNYISSFGIANALNRTAERLNQNQHLKCEINFENILFHTKANELFLFRIIQELISNSIKHAQCSLISISIKKFGNKISLEYFDNGLGMDAQQLKTSANSLGMASISNRVAMLNGTVKYETALQQGFKAFIIFENN